MSQGLLASIVAFRFLFGNIVCSSPRSCFSDKLLWKTSCSLWYWSCWHKPSRNVHPSSIVHAFTREKSFNELHIKQSNDRLMLLRYLKTTSENVHPRLPFTSVMFIYARMLKSLTLNIKYQMSNVTKSNATMGLCTKCHLITCQHHVYWQRSQA